MGYSGSSEVGAARESLGTALEALQTDPNIPEDVMSVTQNIAQAVGALFEAQNASSEVDGKASVKSAMGFLSQTMALLQNVGGGHAGITTATEAIAKVMGILFPLSQAVSVPPGTRPTPAAPSRSHAAVIPTGGPREKLEANVGATTESNFFVGFSGDIGEGGVFVATYTSMPLGTPVDVLVTLPGGFESAIAGVVRFVRDPMDMDSEPGIGVGFQNLDREARELILRFIRKRPPLFFDD